MNILGIIPARAGSKRLKNKNIRPFVGATLTHFAIRQALGSNLLDKIVVNSDSEDVLTIAANFEGIEILKRPAEFATDTSPAIEYMKHTVRVFEEKGWIPDLLVIIQPTSPIRTGGDIDQTIQLLLQDDSADSAVSIVQLPHMVHPYKFKLYEEGVLFPWLIDEEQRTAAHEIPKIYIRNCAVYVFRVAHIQKGITYGQKCLGYVMKPETAVDINDMLDFQFAEYLVQKNQERQVK